MAITKKSMDPRLDRCDGFLTNLPDPVLML
jgi:hypothetical protein